MKDIKYMAERKGLKMADVARLTGVSEPMLSCLVNGRRNLTVETAKKLAPVLNTEWWELID